MKKSKGSISVEWVVVTLIMVLILFAPMPGSEQSVVAYMMQSIREFNEHGSFLYSLP